MPRLLILYGSTHGQTAKIAEFLGHECQALGTPADVVRAGPDAPSPAGYAGVIVAASIHAGGYQRPVMRWVRTHASTLQGMRTAFLSVCLGVLEKEPKVAADLQRIKNEFAERTGWEPPIARFVAGALPWSRYNWLVKLVMRRIVARAGGDTDTSRDYEYTDWAELRSFLRSFVVSCGAQAVPLGVAEATRELRGVTVG